MYFSIASSASYPTVPVVIAGKMSEEDRIDLMRFLFMGPTRSVGPREQEDEGVVDDWLEGDSEISVPELIADLDDSFLGLATEEQGKEAAVVEEQGKEAAVVEEQGKEAAAVEETIFKAPEDPTDQTQERPVGPSEETGGSGDGLYVGEVVVAPAQSTPSLSIKSLTLYRLLGEGGFGKVYAANLKGSSKVHAVKVIPKTEENEDQAFREQDLLRRLIGCPFFSELEASWQSSLNYYIITPIYPGNLQEEVDKTCGLSIDVAHFYIKQILAGVDHLHSHYILHRDLKLDNVLLTQDGHAVICDFGLATMVLPDGRARRSGEEDPHNRLPEFYVEKQSYCFGTPQSTAPEIVLGNSYGFPSDMWSIGVMIYEIVTGQLPWKGEYENTTELYKTIMQTDPEFVPREWSVDAGLCLITLRLLRKDPSRRPAMGELLFSHVFQEFGGWESVQDFSKPGPLRPDRFSKGKKLKEFWPGYELERDQVTDTVPSFAFAGSEILEEVKDQMPSSPTFQPIRALRRKRGQLIARVRPHLARINTSDIPDSLPQADSVPRISSATSHGSINIPDVEDLPELSFNGQEGSPKMNDEPQANFFPSLANLYLDEAIHPFPSLLLHEAVPLAIPPPLSGASSRLPSSEATSVYSSDIYFSSTDSLGEIAASTSTTPLAGLRGLGGSHRKSKQGKYGVERKWFGWVGRLWRRGFGGRRLGLGMV